jgi:hypothetical protein
VYYKILIIFVSNEKGGRPQFEGGCKKQ